MTVIHWSKYRLGNSLHVMHYGLTPPLEISTVFKGNWQSPCTALTAGFCLPLVLCKEAVKQYHAESARICSKYPWILFHSISLSQVNKSARIWQIHHWHYNSRLPKLDLISQLTHWGLNKIAAILQMIFWNAFSLKKSFLFHFKTFILSRHYLVRNVLTRRQRGYFSCNFSLQCCLL